MCVGQCTRWTGLMSRNDKSLTLLMFIFEICLKDQALMHAS